MDWSDDCIAHNVGCDCTIKEMERLESENARLRELERKLEQFTAIHNEYSPGFKP